MEQHFDVRVYYEDTDCMGVVYHANYLHFLERARTEFFHSVGPSLREWTDRGYVFPIYSVNVTFKAPARLGDGLCVTTRAWQSSPFRVSFDQRIDRKVDGRRLVEAKVEAVCTDSQGNLREYPEIRIPKEP